VRLAAALCGVAGLAAAGELRNAEEIVVKAVAAARPSVVTVITPEPKDVDQTGVVVAPGGIVLTIRSTMLGPDGRLPSQVPVRFPGSGDTVLATVLASHEASDTAVLQAGGSAKYLRIAPADSAKPGAFAILLGNAFGQGRESTPTVALGTVSGLVRTRAGVEAILASCLVNPGSIGAPLVDGEGELLGLVTSRVTDDGGQSVVVPYESIRRAYASNPAVGKLIDRPAPARASRGHIAEQFAEVAADVLERGRTALVGVRAAAAEGETPPPGPSPVLVPGKLPAWDRSSGLVVSADGYVVCPLRVTGWPNAERAMTVDLPGGAAHAARIVGTDERTRLALLKIDAAGLPVLRGAPPEARRPGTLAFAIGFPHMDPGIATPPLTCGVVSRTGALASLHAAFDAVQTDAAVNGGNRGGPLLDLDGRLLGVLLDVNDTEPQGYFTRGPGRYAGNAGLGFAVPPERLAEIVEKLKKGIALKAAYLGVSVEAAEGGLRIVTVSEKNQAGEPTAAADAGLKPGDLLVSVDGVALKKPRDLRAAIGRLAANDVAEVVYVRDGERKSVHAALGSP